MCPAYYINILVLTTKSTESTECHLLLLYIVLRIRIDYYCFIHFTDQLLLYQLHYLLTTYYTPPPTTTPTPSPTTTTTTTTKYTSDGAK